MGMSEILNYYEEIVKNQGYVSGSVATLKEYDKTPKKLKKNQYLYSEDWEWSAGHAGGKGTTTYLCSLGHEDGDIPIPAGELRKALKEKYNYILSKVKDNLKDRISYSDTFIVWLKKSHIKELGLIEELSPKH